jgi:plasmid stabilization system protein ParE
VEELAEAIGWYGERDEVVANEFRDAVRSKLREAAHAPHHWPLEPDGTRQILLGSFPYVLIVREIYGSLQVVAVSHTSRRPGYWRKRLRD